MRRDRDSSTADGPHMSADQMDAFLARPLIARLATAGRDEPRVAPMWYRWDGRYLWFETSPTFTAVRILAENPRAAVTIDESLGGLQLRAVIMRGSMTTIAGPPEAVDEGVRAIYERYLDVNELATMGRAMLQDNRHVLLRLNPERIITWDTTATHHESSRHLPAPAVANPKRGVE